METGLMRARACTTLIAMFTLFAGGAALADGRCNLNGLVGYQVLFGKPVEGYIQDGIRHKGYEGCEPDRVLVFSDNTGVRCKDLDRQSFDGLPIGYLFIRSVGDMKLCVEGQLMDVSQTN